MFMLPWCSSMHLVKDWVAPAQLLPQVLLFSVEEGAAGATAWGLASATEEEPPPEKRPPMAWPMEEPIATPLQYAKESTVLAREMKTSFIFRESPELRGEKEGRTQQC